MSLPQPPPVSGKNRSPEASANGSSATAVITPLHAMMLAVETLARKRVTRSW